VIFGTVLAFAYSDYPFNVLYFLLAFFGMVILHSAANILNDYYDYNKGLDKVANPVSGGVVRGIISTKEAKTASILLFSLGTIIGLTLVYLTGITLLYIGLVGLLIGVFYTAGNKISLKYNGLGDLAVFMNFGILGSLGAWYVQTGTLSWIPVLWAIPMSTLVIAILHANNWRDIISDKEGKIFTVASLLGDKKSLNYYGFLIYGPFIMVVLLILVPYIMFPELNAMPFTFLITLLALPLAIKLWKKGLNRKTPEKPLDFVALDGATAKLNLVFGSLCTIALLIHVLIQHLV
ncbi:1,4-dihydroxy-2-naphthoate octaprenyltransferase, partial [Bacteroidota bacterium]